MKRCANCGKTYEGSEKFCRDDGSALVDAASPDETATVVGPMPADPDATPPFGGRPEPDGNATPLMTAVPQVSAKLAALQGKTQPPPLPGGKPKLGGLPDLQILPGSSPSARHAIKVAAVAAQQTVAEQAPEDPEFQSSYSGKTIDGRYLIGRLIGHGGMGAVFECEQVHLRKRMAVKLLHENLVQKKALIARFQREARAISRLSSPHTVMVYDFGRWGELFFLVMELLEGEALDAVLEQTGPMPPERVARIVLQMCDSLSEAHKHGIIHRDLKPENVMLVRNQAHPDFVKILDFGLAKVQGINDEDQVHSQRDIFGTPFYMSPEQIRAAEVDGRADIYAVGTLMFKMLTGQQVFRYKNTFDILKAHLSEAPPKMSALAPQLAVPPALERIVAKALQKDPQLRFGSMDEMALALAQTLRSGFRESGLVMAAGTLEGEATAEPAKDARSAGTGKRRNRPTQLSNITKLSDIFDPDELLQSHKSGQRKRTALFFAAIAVAILGAAAALWWSSHAPQESETEPNDDLQTANRLGPGDQTRGVIGKRRSERLGDRDCFLLPRGDDDQDLEISVRGVPNMDLQLALLAGANQPPTEISHRGKGLGESVRFWDPMKRPVAVCVQELPQAGQTPGESLSDQYTLAVARRPRPAAAEREPNDDAPGNDVKGMAQVQGCLDGAGDRDVFAVPGSCDGRLLRVRVDAAAGQEAGGLRLDLFDGGRHLIAARTAKPDETKVELAFVGATRQLPDHVAVSRVAKDGRGDELNYTITFDIADIADQPEREPNDSEDAAQALVPGAWHTGDIGDASQTDWLRVDGGDSGSKNARIEVSAPKGAWVLTVRDLGSKTDLRVVPVLDAAVKEVVVNNATGEGLLLRLGLPDGKGRPVPAQWRLRARTYGNGQFP